MSEAPDTPVLWTSEDAAAATGGRATAPWRAAGVSIDSRTMAPGDLFVAIRGPNFDGHAFIAQALARGAAAAMVATVPEDVPEGAPLLVVGDTLAGLEALGRAARARTAARVIGITGSVGKTSTKEALAHVLSRQGRTFATPGSFNNHWGVPLSLSRLPPGAIYAVFELGMNHAGELGPLARMVRPDVAVITTVEPAHLEHFGTVEAIADAKAEILEGVEAGGIVVLNRDNPQFARLAATARERGIGRVWSFGAGEGAEARLMGCNLHPGCSSATALIRGERIDYMLSLPGRHQVMNSLAVLLAASAAGADPTVAAAALAGLTPVKGRGVRQRIEGPDGAFTLIDESYNASPAAMRAAFEILSRIDPGAGGRRIVALGDMLELGAAAPRLHADLATALRAARVDTVHGCGPHTRTLMNALPDAMRGVWTEASEALVPHVQGAVRAGDVVLVKGSAGSKMGLVVAALAALHRNAAEADAPAANGRRG
jgi:UDP-N-acetylmuramoyl-tripeptide--D-alanyl-D-alanine ligase